MYVYRILLEEERQKGRPLASRFDQLHLPTASPSFTSGFGTLGGSSLSSSQTLTSNGLCFASSDIPSLSATIKVWTALELVDLKFYMQIIFYEHIASGVWTGLGTHETFNFRGFVRSACERSLTCSTRLREPAAAGSGTRKGTRCCRKTSSRRSPRRQLALQIETHNRRAKNVWWWIHSLYILYMYEYLAEKIFVTCTFL